MSAEADLRTLLASASAVTSLVGARISADRIAQDAVRPFIVFVRSATLRERGLDGTLHGSKVTFSIQAWADTRVAALAVIEAVQSVLESNHHAVVDHAADSDPDLDLEAATLSVDIWE
jgi:Protein of unknown function (DUF3168)